MNFGKEMLISVHTFHLASLPFLSRQEDDGCDVDYPRVTIIYGAFNMPMGVIAEFV